MGKQQREVKMWPEGTPTPSRPAQKTLTGFAVDKVDGGRYLAVKITTAGGYEVLTPRRHDSDFGESKALAWQRCLEAQALWAKRRGG